MAMPPSSTTQWVVWLMPLSGRPLCKNTLALASAWCVCVDVFLHLIYALLGHLEVRLMQVSSADSEHTLPPLVCGSTGLFLIHSEGDPEVRLLEKRNSNFPLCISLVYMFTIQQCFYFEGPCLPLWWSWNLSFCSALTWATQVSSHLPLWSGLSAECSVNLLSCLFGQRWR